MISPTKPHDPHFRPEIQGLRAIAVLAVLVFHVWPAALPGGYVGVDVFFVISGYLITSLLLREAERTGSISLRRFFARRIRRLLPAATLVLLAVAALSPLVPEVRWADIAVDIGASALYVQNWWLAGQAIDYLAAESAASPLKHFWSLSIEEQYYIFWPCLAALAMAAFSAARRAPRRLFGLMVIVMGLASLAYSIYLSPRNPGLAYFATTTRIWELAMGGALATFGGWHSFGPRLRNVLRITGLAGIAASALLFDGNTVFPGYAALLPTICTAFVIMAGTSSAAGWSGDRLLCWRPMQYLGGVSYSLYLWHWPAIFFFPFVVGRSASLADGVLLILVSLVLAHLSKVLVEDRFRAGTTDAPVFVGPYVLASVLIVASLAGSVAVGQGWIQMLAQRPPGGVTATPYPGATSISDSMQALPDAAGVAPAQWAAAGDRSAAYADGCVAGPTQAVASVCEYGNGESGQHVVLLGDTRAIHWLPALQVIAEEEGWRLSVMGKVGCPFVDVPVRFEGSDVYGSCEEWKQSAFEKLMELEPDRVITSQAATTNVYGDQDEIGSQHDRMQAGLVSAWSRLQAAGIRVQAIRDTPRREHALVLCVQEAEGDFTDCGSPRDAAFPRPDPLVAASLAIKGVDLVDMTDMLCERSMCPAVIGSVIVWRSRFLLTATYSRSMAPELARRLGLPTGDAMVSAAVGGEGATGTPDITPLPSEARGDNPELYSRGCHVDQVDSEPRPCEFGDPKAGTHVVLVGDSHAAQWLPALQLIARHRGWRITSFTKSACSFTAAVASIRSRRYDSCSEWNELVLKEIAALSPALVFTSQSSGLRAFGTESEEESLSTLAQGLSRQWRNLQEVGIPVVVVKDTPWMQHDVPDCMTSRGASFAQCSTPRSEAFRPDSIPLAVESTPGVVMIDVGEEVCGVDSCPPVIDGMLVWRDRHHLTATFVTHLAPSIEPVLVDLLD